MIAFKTQEQNPDADPAINPLWPWQVEVITSDEQLMRLVSDGWNIVSNREYDDYCDRVGTVTTPSFAVDMDNVDQEIVAGVTKVLGTRVLWDKTGVYDTENHKYVCDRDGVINLNGTVTVSAMAGVNEVAVDIHRNDEIYFTVAERSVVGEAKTALAFSCDVDGYKSSDHDFDIRVRIDAGTATISGSDEETAWGGSWVATLHQESPT